MTFLALIFAATAIAYFIAAHLRIPRIPVLILIGLAMSPFLADAMQIELRNHLDLSLTFLLFGAGTELNPARLKSHLKAAFWVGTMQFSVVFMGGLLMAGILGFGLTHAIVLALGLSVSSTLAVLQFLRTRQQITEPFGRLIIGVLLLQDLIFLTLMAGLTRWNQPFIEVALGIGWFLVLMALAVFCQRVVFPKFMSQWAEDVEFLVLASLGICFTFVWLAVHFNLPPILGAFLAGFSLASFPSAGILRGVLGSFFEFFVGIFFVSLGATLIISDWKVLGAGLALSAVVWIFSPLTVFVVSRLVGRSWRGALCSGFYLAQTSELSLVLGLTCLRSGIIDDSVMNLLTVATIFTTLATPFLTSQKLTDFLLHALSRFDIQAKKLDSNLHNHALVLGFGDGGPHLLKPIQESGYPVLVIEDDGQVVDQLRKMKIPCIFGDAGDPNLLKRAGIDRAAFVLVSMRRFEDIREVLRYASQVQIFVRVFEESEARKVLELGGIPVSSADASVQSLELWLSKIFLNGKPRA